jgi:hypothetical protein
VGVASLFSQPPFPLVFNPSGVLLSFVTQRDAVWDLQGSGVFIIEVFT